MTNCFQDPQLLSALYAAGVDNWDWYSESLSTLSDPDTATDLEILNALENGGVDNWEWYDIALDLYKDATEDSTADSGTAADIAASIVAEDDAAEDTATAEADEPVAPELTPAERLLLATIGQEEFDRVRGTFFKRGTHPKEFDRALKVLPNGGTLQEAQVKLVELVYSKAQKSS